MRMLKNRNQLYVALPTIQEKVTVFLTFLSNVIYARGGELHDLSPVMAVLDVLNSLLQRRPRH